MKPAFQFDDKEFAKAVEFVEKATGRTARETINRAGLHVIIGGKGFQGAMQLTPKASKSAIRAIDKEAVRGYLAKKLGGFKGMTKGQIAALVVQEIKRRVRAIGYTAFVGWSNAAKAFGGRGLKGVTGSAKKLARFGLGRKATSTTNPEAVLVNTAPMAEKIGLTPLQKAITNVARDLVEYGTRRLAKTFKAVSK